MFGFKSGQKDGDSTCSFVCLLMLYALAIGLSCLPMIALFIFLLFTDFFSLDMLLTIVYMCCFVNAMIKSFERGLSDFR